MVAFRGTRNEIEAEKKPTDTVTHVGISQSSCHEAGRNGPQQRAQSEANLGDGISRRQFTIGTESTRSLFLEFLHYI